MKKLFLTLILGVFASLSISVHATLYRSYQTEDGLSHNSVWAAMQDSRGFMWFGTNDGLNRFDGVRFKVYRRIDGDSLSLGSNFIHCLLEKPDGDIMVGTKEGLYSYSPSDDKFRHIRLDNSRYGNDRNSVHCLEFDKSGNLWVGCYGQGVYCLDKNMKVRKHYGAKKLPSRFVTAMVFDLNGTLWIGTDNAGLFKLNPANGTTSKTPIDHQNIQTIYRNNNNTLWIGTSANGLYNYNPLSQDVENVTTVDGNGNTVHNVKALTPLNANELALGSDAGLLRLDCSTSRLSHFDMEKAHDSKYEKSIFAIAVDNEGGIWLGTYFYGISYLSPRVNAFSFQSTGGENDIVQRLLELPDGKLIYTTNNRGASVYDPKTRQGLPLQCSTPPRTSIAFF